MPGAQLRFTDADGMGVTAFATSTAWHEIVLATAGLIAWSPENGFSATRKARAEIWSGS